MASRQRDFFYFLVNSPNFETLVEEHYRALYRFAFSLSKDENSAWDLTQQTFLLWATKGHQLRDATKAKTWLFSTLYHEFLAQHKRQARFVSTNENDEILSSAEVAPEIPVEVDGAVVEKSLLQLKEEHRAVLLLFYLRSHSYRDIADILQIPIGTVMSRMSRAKLEMRKLLVRTPEGIFLKNPSPPNHRK